MESVDGVNDDKSGEIGRYFGLDPNGKSLMVQMKDIARLIYKYNEWYGLEIFS